MKRTLPFLLYLAALSAISGWLMSRMSWISRVGMNLMHKEYKFLKVWYEGGAVVFGVLLILFVVHSIFQNRTGRAVARTAHITALLLALAGLYFTYSDFHGDFSHSLLKERFHLGAYLFWIGWLSICIFFLTKVRQARTTLQV